MVAPVINMPNTVKHNGISGIPTQLLVLHSAECPLRGGYAQSLTDWANTPLEQGGPIASWQRFVDPIARVRMVPDQYAAWHASEANPMSIGWEQAGYAAFSRAQWETPEGLKQLDNLAYDMAEVAKRDGIPPIWLTTDQVEAVTHRGNRSIKGFCIHAQIDPDIRTDPGSNYPYDRLMDRIKHYLGTGGAPAVAPQAGNITPAKPKEDTLSAAEVKQINAHTSAENQKTREYMGQLMVSGYTVGPQEFPGSTKVDIENQRRINALTTLVTKVLERPDLSADEITAAIEKGLANGAVTVDINVKGAPNVA